MELPAWTKTPIKSYTEDDDEKAFSVLLPPIISSRTALLALLLLFFPRRPSLIFKIEVKYDVKSNTNGYSINCDNFPLPKGTNSKRFSWICNTFGALSTLNCFFARDNFLHPSHLYLLSPSRTSTRVNNLSACSKDFTFAHSKLISMHGSNFADSLPQL